LLTDNGWKKGSDGKWADKNGKVPEIKWMINSGNKRREDSQALMIPKMQAAGFNVVPDNCDAACVFQKRQPVGDYDLAMYISTAAPDPTVTSVAHCDQVPSAANDNKGQNTIFWCNQEASKLMSQSDQEIDVAKRVDLIHRIGKIMADDAITLPLFQFPNIAAYRTDKVSGAVDADAANYRGFANNMFTWAPKSGTDVVVGAEQWPDCINPVTECANSSWAVWTVSFQVLPGAWDTTAKGEYVPTDLLTGEPKVDIKG
jgi:ABC-type transport system substrate-binding protein